MALKMFLLAESIELEAYKLCGEDGVEPLTTEEAERLFREQDKPRRVRPGV